MKFSKDAPVDEFIVPFATSKLYFGLSLLIPTPPVGFKFMLSCEPEVISSPPTLIRKTVCPEFGGAAHGSYLDESL